VRIVGPEGRPLRAFDAQVYAECTGVLPNVLDPETTRTTQSEGAALSLKEALEAELMRSATTVVANPVDWPTWCSEPHQSNP
jgi:hypothetical protein